jgi:glyoxylate/hydroxypyruvate reductase A
MRIHIQNPDGDDLFAITEAQWDNAATRHGAAGHAASFGTAPGETEILIAPPGVLARMLPLALPHLKMIFLTASGPDRLMPFTWLPPGVALVNNRGVHGRKVGEYVAMALLMLANRMPDYAAQQREQLWQPHFSPVLRGRRVTVVGTGDLGAGAARQARHFGMVVTGVNTSGRSHPDFDQVVTGLDAVLPGSEFLVLACPLTEQTRNLLDRRRIGLLPPGAGLVNVGRGALLDMVALCDRLDAGTLSGAVCDVFDPEPIAPGDRIWTTSRMVITPHVAADDPSSYNADSLDLFFVNLAAWQVGAVLPNLVDLARGY